jgi:hypothetical protein
MGRGDGPVSVTNIEWSTIASMLAAAGILSTLLYLLLRARLTNDFLTRREHVETMDRLRKVEEEIQAMPTRDDVAGLRAQLFGVSERVAVVNASLNGLQSGVTRIERHLDLMMQSQLERENKP